MEYVVKQGDSLSKIALEKMGNLMDWQLIYEANKDVISNPDAIQPGMKIWIPVGGAPKPTGITSAILSPIGVSLPKMSANKMMLYAGIGLLGVTALMAAKRLRGA